MTSKKDDINLDEEAKWAKVCMAIDHVASRAVLTHFDPRSDQSMTGDELISLIVRTAWEHEKVPESFLETNTHDLHKALAATLLGAHLIQSMFDMMITNKLWGQADTVVGCVESLGADLRERLVNEEGPEDPESRVTDHEQSSSLH